MSAFVVSDETLNRFLSWVYREAQTSNGITYGSVCRTLESAGYPVANMLGVQKLGRAMFGLNCKAVRQRYEDADDSAMIPADYRFVLLPSITSFVALKALRCWHYQCCEGNVPETSRLYKLMDGVAADMALSIVNALPQYEQAPWD